MKTITPGKWEIAEGLNRNAQRAIRIESTPDDSGNVPTVALICGEGEYLTAEREANARLIAAAPDLARELKGVTEALIRVLDKHDPDSIESEWIGNANEAYQKAFGKDITA